MFHWICPECGREIPPAMTECPACDPKPEQASTLAAPPLQALPEAVSAVVPQVPPVPSNPVPATAPVLSNEPDPKTLVEAPIEIAMDPLLVLAERIRAAQTGAKEPAPAQAQPVPQLRELAAAVGVGEAPTLELIPVATLPPPAAAPMAIAQPAQPIALLAPPELKTVAAPVALADPIPAPLPPPPIPPEIREERVAPPQSISFALTEPVSAPAPPPLPQEVREEPAASAPAETISAPEEPAAPTVEAAPVDAAPRESLLTIPEPVRKPVAPVQPVPPAALAEPIAPSFPSPAAPQPPESRVEALVQAPPPPPEKPADQPPFGLGLKLAPLQDYSATAARAMRPAAPPVKILTPDSGPRMTLPGPALPAQLTVRENLNVATVQGARPRKQRSIPGWLISFLVMAALLTAGIAVVFYLLPASHTTADAKTTPPEPVTAAPVVEESHPLSQFIEVTGFRFVMDLNKKAEIHYLVVNHSSAELGDMTVFVTVRTASAKPGQPPLCRFSFRSTGLAPFESKEMTSAIEKLPRPVTLPDWHDLRAEVQIAQ